MERSLHSSRSGKDRHYPSLPQIRSLASLIAMESEEALREAACIGNVKAVRKLIGSGTSVNSQNSMNGWLVIS